MLAASADTLVNFRSRNELETLLLACRRLREEREAERKREREGGEGGREETVTCNKCDRFINLSSCVGRREKPRCRSLALLGRRREKERVGETRARKVTFLRFSPSCTEASVESRERRNSRLRAEGGGGCVHMCITPTWSPSLPRRRSGSGNRNAATSERATAVERRRDIFSRASRLATFKIPSRSRTCHSCPFRVSRQEARGVKCDCYRYMCLMDS